MKSNLKDFALNRKVCFPMGDQAEESVACILSWKPDYLYGYASLLLEAAALVDKQSLRFMPPKCVICTAETIMPAQKEYLTAVFKAPVVEEYGATEFDIVAFECGTGHRHFVNPWLVVRESYGSLLVSDVSRKSTSFINYDIGDSGMIKDSECTVIGGTHYLAALEGRTIHRFAYIDPETRFHSVDLGYAMNEYQCMENEVFSFRIIQSEFGAIDLYISSVPSNGPVSLQQFIQNSIREKTGRDIVVNVFVGEKSVELAEKSYFVQRIRETASGVVLT
ncbi:CoF synthetase [Marinobacter sediminum]|uniref:CoF synthetase n=1 Tax=Marinobacter sediminum TaxID=256323 RepID=UPI00202DEC0F|nr:CoF synthetase [Marinobacter sediminum]MCM0611822.1 CoF synthetase [Marinobacter sediminum]